MPDNIHRDPEDLLHTPLHDLERRLTTSRAHGLSVKEAITRLHRHGFNELPQEEQEPLLWRFLRQFNERFILMLIASAVISLVLGDVHDALSISFAVLLVVTIGFYQEYQSDQAIAALQHMVPEFANVIRSDGEPRSAGVKDEAMSDSNQSQIGDTAAIAGRWKAHTRVPAREIVIGDLVVFSTGDRIPADVRLSQTTDLSIDESNLTGENEPSHKFADTASTDTSTENAHPSSTSHDGLPSPTLGLDSRKNSIRQDAESCALQGTMVMSGHGQGIVVGTGQNTKFGRISESLRSIESPRTPLQLAMDNLGQQLSYVALAVIIVIVVIGWLQGKMIFDMFKIGISLAVAAIPEGLPLTVSVTLAISVRRMSKRGATVKKIPHVETLGSVNVVCSDKTGTLTMNHMTITRLWHFGLETPRPVEALANSPGKSAALVSMLKIGNMANNARFSQKDKEPPIKASRPRAASDLDTDTNGLLKRRRRCVGQPTDVALLELLDSFEMDDMRDQAGTRIAETPFNSRQKWMGVIVTDGPGSGADTADQTAFVKGAIEQVLSRCDSYVTASGAEIILDQDKRTEAMASAEEMARGGLRVLALARKTLAKEPGVRRSPNEKQAQHALQDNDDSYRGLVFAGLVGIFDPPRNDVSRSVGRLLRGGVRVIMITGDAKATALAIARRIGMPINFSSSDNRQILQGSDLDAMSEDELAQMINKVTIFARTNPEHKLKIVRAFQMRGDTVAMTGDGVNDAPALKKANIGIAMGASGTDVAKEAADMVLMDDNFSTILTAIEESKGIFYNIQNFLTFQLSTSLAALSLVLVSTGLGYAMPLNPTQILWINVLMDGPPAQSLGREPVDPAVMNRPPRRKGQQVLTRRLIQRVLTSGLVIMFGTLMVYRFEMAKDYSVDRHDTTMTFTCFVFSDMFNALTCRSESKSLLRGEYGLLDNANFNYSVGLSLLGQLAIVYLPFFQTYADTEALTFKDIIILLLVASSVFWIDEGKKIWRARNKKHQSLSHYSASV